jgi:hypothetical protein
MSARSASETAFVAICKPASAVPLNGCSISAYTQRGFDTAYRCCGHQRDTSTTGLRRRPPTLFAKFRHCNVRLLGSSFPFQVIYPHEENHPFRHYRRFCPWRLFVRLRRRSSPPRLPQGEGAWPLAKPLPLTEDRARTRARLGTATTPLARTRARSVAAQAVPAATKTRICEPGSELFVRVAAEVPVNVESFINTRSKRPRKHGHPPIRCRPSRQ